MDVPRFSQRPRNVVLRLKGLWGDPSRSEGADVDEVQLPFELAKTGVNRVKSAGLCAHECRLNRPDYSWRTTGMNGYKSMSRDQYDIGL